MWTCLTLCLLAASPAPAAGPDEVRVVSWNTWGMPFPFASSPRRGRFPGISERLETMGVDVAGLQEVWRGARRLLDLRGLHWPRSGGDSGLALMTAHPTSAVRLHNYEAGFGVDRLKAKGVLASRVEVDGAPLWVLVTHLQAGTATRASAARGAQIDELLGVLDDLEGPAVVMGDFNLYDHLPQDKAAIERLHDAGLVDAAGDDTTSTHESEDARLDRIYTRSGPEHDLWVSELQVASAAGLSDHRPVLATLVVD